MTGSLPAGVRATHGSSGAGPLMAAGVAIPRIGLGTFRTSPDEARDLVVAAVEAGYRHIDTAIMYENESGVGQGVRDCGLPRGEVFVTTKVPRTAAAGPDALEAARRSIRTLDIGYIDLLLLHWPNPEVAPEETFAALVPLVEEGVVRALGTSNANTELVRRALTVTPLATVQVERHPYLRQEALSELVVERDLTLTAYAPFAEGRVFDDAVLSEIGQKYGKNAGQVTLRWLLDQPRTIVIPKTATPSRLVGNLDVFDFALDADDRARIDALGQTRQRFFDPPFPVEWDNR